MLAAFVLMGCTALELEGPTLVPPEMLPTIIAQTVNARQTESSAAQLALSATSTATPKPPTSTATPISLGATSTTAVPENTLAALPTWTPLPTSAGTATHTSTPTHTLSPTPSATATQTPTPSKTATPKETATETLTPSLTPSNVIPITNIEITKPGQLSKVVSPILLRAMVNPSPDGKVTIELIGEDGRLLVRKIIIMNPNLGRKVGLVVDLPFEVEAGAELARLQIVVHDDLGRIREQNAVDLLLLSDGQEDYNAAGDLLERAFIQLPYPGTLIQGGKVVVTGLARPLYGEPLVVELINANGTVVGTRLVGVASGPAEVHRPFSVEVPYQIDAATWVQLVVRERGERIPGTAYLVSQQILISP